jgi:RNase P/RNase MRP subunit POP5
MEKGKKLKLKPSQRDKRRYFILNTLESVKVKKALLDYLGILGSAKADYNEIRVKEIKGKIVGSCLRKSLEDVRAGLALAGISVEKVSGTIKGLLK